MRDEATLKAALEQSIKSMTPKERSDFVRSLCSAVDACAKAIVSNHERIWMAREPTALPVVHPAGERTASSEGPREAQAGYGALPDEQDGASPPVQQGVVEALESAHVGIYSLSGFGMTEKARVALTKIDAALASLRPPAPLMEKQ